VPETKDEIFTAPEVAEILRVKPYRVLELARMDILPHFKLGRQIRFPAAKIREFIAEGGKALPGGWRKTA
jgi:excisionase family DNA binding protein